MHRQIVYPSAIPQDIDLLNTNKNAMVALGYLIQAILGGETQVDGLACEPSSPASMLVNLFPGSIYSLEEVDATAYGSLAADTTDQIMKQGIYPGGVFTLSAPTGSGQSVVYLIQAEYQDVDGGSEVLPYYNASNPSVPFSGPGNEGTPNYTIRQGLCTVAVKTGTPAATGSQVAPTPDAGYVGLWAITVANGQTTITSGNISQAAGAQLVGPKLSQKLNAASNLSDVVSAATALANLGGAPLASPTFTGSPKAVTPSTGDNTSNLATTAFVQNAFAAHVLSYSGYQVFPGGLILQWMQVSLTAGGTPNNGFYGDQAGFSFPMTFPNNCLLCVASPINTAGVEGGAGVSNPTTSGVAVSVQNTLAGSSPANVIAIGN